MSNPSPITVIHSLARKYPHGVPVRIVGRSMEPTLRDGDGVLLDTSHTAPTQGEIVAVCSDHLGGRICGRFHASSSGAWLTKDNPEFPPVFLGKPDRFKIEGAIVAICSRDTNRAAEV